MAGTSSGQVTTAVSAIPPLRHQGTIPGARPLHPGAVPGWFMIPSIEEYGVYCTSLKFNQCPWFRGTGEGETG